MRGRGSRASHSAAGTNLAGALVFFFFFPFYLSMWKHMIKKEVEIIYLKQNRGFFLLLFLDPKVAEAFWHPKDENLDGW